MRRRDIALRAALALLTALILVSLFPRFNLRLLAPVALTPLLVALAATPRAGQRFIYGWGAGIVYWFFLCTWIQFVLEVHAQMGFWGGWGSFLVFCILKALHLALFSLLAGPLLNRVYAIPAVAALWVGLERTHGTFGFAWLALGNAGINMSVPLRLAPYVGVYGLSFVFCMLSAALALVVLRRPRLHLAPLLALALLPAFPAIKQNYPADLTAGIVQPDLDPELEWTTGTLTSEESHLLLLSRLIPAPLVIWPELPAPLYYYSDPTFHREAQEIAIRHGYFLFGTVTMNAAGEPLNSAVMLGPGGQEIGHYDQIFLVPFGEFTPRMFAWVNRITHESGDFVPGNRIQVTPMGTHRVGVFICYESAFPHLVRQFSKAGADVFINISNDGYFGHSEARQQHLLLVQMRAVENRRFIVRATNDGTTAVVNPAGRIIKTLPPYQELASLVQYGAVSETTFYARHGDWFAWGCLAVGLALSILQLLPTKRKSA
jgi:apolipoprotein N-acyltransferase